jgi:hypothetical protein
MVTVVACPLCRTVRSTVCRWPMVDATFFSKLLPPPGSGLAGSFILFYLVRRIAR